MKSQIIQIVLSLVLMVTALLCLFLFPDILVDELWNGSDFPLGTLISWLGIIGFALFGKAVYPFKVNTLLYILFRRMLLLNVFLAVSWGFISYWLAASWAFTFTHRTNFNIWIILTTFIIVLPLIVILISGVSRLFCK